MATWAVTTANTSLEFDTQANSGNSCFIIDANHFINFWKGFDTAFYSQVFTVNTTTWAVTTANSVFTVDTTTSYLNSCSQIDANHFIDFYGNANNAGLTQVFTVNTTTWAITTSNSALTFETSSNTSNNSCCKIDDTHFINFWQGGASTYGLTQVFTVNTTTWAVTTANSVLQFEASAISGNSCYKIDTNHILLFWSGVDADGFAQVFTINTSTFAVTTAGDSLEFDTTAGLNNSCYQIDSTHFINFWGGSGNDGYVQVFTVNTTTWAVTTAAESLEFNITNGLYNSCSQIDANHFIDFYSGAGSDGFAQVITVNTSTFAVTTSAVGLEFDTQNGLHNSCYKIDTNHFINFWNGLTNISGLAQVFTVELPASTLIKSVNGLLKASVKSFNGLAIASVKSINGLT